MADELHAVATARALAGRVVFFAGRVGAVAARARARLVFAFVDL